MENILKGPKKFFFRGGGISTVAVYVWNEINVRDHRDLDKHSIAGQHRKALTSGWIRKNWTPEGMEVNFIHIINSEPTLDRSNTTTTVHMQQFAGLFMTLLDVFECQTSFYWEWTLNGIFARLSHPPGRSPSLCPTEHLSEIYTGIYRLFACWTWLITTY